MRRMNGSVFGVMIVVATAAAGGCGGSTAGGGSGGTGGSVGSDGGGNAEKKAFAMLIPLLPGGKSNSATGISGNGRHVVGVGDGTDGLRGYIYDVDADKLTELGVLPDGVESAALGTDMQGKVVVGTSYDSGGSATAFIWTDGKMTSLGDLPFGYEESMALGVSGDGTVVVGNLTGEALGSSPFLWTEKDGYFPIPRAGEQALATAISRDGTTIVGATEYSIEGEAGSAAFHWTHGRGFLTVGCYETAQPDCSAAAVSADGSLFAGSAVATMPGITQTATLPVFWDPAQGGNAILITPNDPAHINGMTGRVVRAVNDSGSVMVGGAADAGMAFYWDDEFGYSDLTFMMAEANVLEPLGGGLPMTAVGVSKDGLIVVGNVVVDTFRAFVTKPF